MTITVLAAIKAVESQESLLLIADDLDAMKVMAAWLIHAPVYTDRDLKEGETAINALRECWSTCKYDLMRLSDVANVPLNTTREIFNRLKEARLIYPDGTIPVDAKKIVRSEIPRRLVA